jgi:hypothetical protein
MRIYICLTMYKIYLEEQKAEAENGEDTIKG